MTATAKPNKKHRNKVTYIPIDLPAEGVVRLPSVLKVLGISKNTYLEGAKAGKYPQGKLLSARIRVYAVDEIREALEKINA
jgi:predicted DNA-binding transcriptional regulator AlpA